MTWSNHNRQQLADAEHDIAVCVVEGIAPRSEDVETVRRLLTKRDAHLEATRHKLPGSLAVNHIDHVQLEAGWLGEPEAAPANDN